MIRKPGPNRGPWRFLSAATMGSPCMSMRAMKATMAFWTFSAERERTRRQQRPRLRSNVARALVHAVSTLVSRPGVWTFRAWGRLLTGDGLSGRLQAGRQPAAGLPTGPTVQENQRRHVG